MNRLGCLTVALLLTTCVQGAFEPPTDAERRRGLGDLLNEPEPLRTLLTPDGDFLPVPPPHRGDWLAVHTEHGQSYQDWRSSGANRLNATRKVIYLQPIGDFPADVSPPLEQLRAYTAAFFQMTVRVLPPYFPHDLEFEPRTNPRQGRRQIMTSRVEDFLKSRLPDDAYCLLGVTMTDLYPSPSWNFVFGEASLLDRVGIFSFARYDPEFDGEKRGPRYQELILQRSCKVLVHEAAHMFGIEHCIFYQCVMNGSNGMDETDGQPQHLCPVCLRKLHTAVGFDAIVRYRELQKFYRTHHWYEDADYMKRQLGRLTPDRL